MLGAPETHANQVTLLVQGLTVHEPLSTVKDGQVVDEMHVASLGLDLELGGLRNRLDGIQRLLLLACQCGEVAGSGVSLVAKERSAAEIHDQLAFLMEDDGAAMKLGPVFESPSKSHLGKE